MLNSWKTSCELQSLQTEFKYSNGKMPLQQQNKTNRTKAWNLFRVTSEIKSSQTHTSSEAMWCLQKMARSETGKMSPIKNREGRAGIQVSSRERQTSMCKEALCLTPQCYPKQNKSKGKILMLMTSSFKSLVCPTRAGESVNGHPHSCSTGVFWCLMSTGLSSVTNWTSVFTGDTTLQKRTKKNVLCDANVI